MRPWMSIVVVGACSAPPTASSLLDWPDPPPASTGAVAYDLRWSGALIGEAVQRDTGDRLTRREHLVVRRGDTVVADDLYLEIARVDGRARSVRLERGYGTDRRGGTAIATATGWDVQVDGEPPTSLPPAEPFEDVLAHAAARDGYQGPVLLAGWGFAIAPLTIVRAGPVWRATLDVDGGAVTAEISYDADGVVARVVSGDGVTAERRPLGVPEPRFDPIEVVDGSALVIAGGAGPRLRFPDAASPVPALPGQRTQPLVDGGWQVDLDATAPGALPPGPAGPDQSATIADLTGRVADRIVDDLGVTATTVGAARDAERGDCTTHALALVALADDAGIPTRVVTGLRVDGDRLIRHRWVAAWTGRRWIAVDPTYRESPASARLVGLAIHGAHAADLALVDAVVFDRLGARVSSAAR